MVVAATSVVRTFSVPAAYAPGRSFFCWDSSQPTTSRNFSSPMVTSGVRYGTPAATTRGMGLAEMEQIAQWSVEAIAAREDAAKLEQIRREVVKLAQKFPVPGNDAAELAARES